jgi:hypothetical protein
MSASGAEPAEVLRLALEAISDRDTDRLAALVTPEVTVKTGRASHEGADAVRAWARKGYDHLDRRYVLESMEEVAPGLYVCPARVEYVWRENGEVGDASPIWLTVAMDGALIGRLELHDSEQEARDATV